MGNPAQKLYHRPFASAFHKSLEKQRNGERQRPIIVFYYDNPKAGVEDFVAQGNPSAEAGVIRGAMLRLFMGQYAMARVYRDGNCIMTLVRRADGLPEARFGPHVLGTVRPDGSIDYYSK